MSKNNKRPTVFPEVWGRILIVSKKRRPGTLQGMFSDDKTGEIKIASAWPSEKIKSEILYSVGVMFFTPFRAIFPLSRA